MSAADSGTSSPRGGARRWIIGFFLLVLIPVIALSLAPEISRWKLAQAIDAYGRNEESVAEQLVAEAKSWDPANPAIPLLQAHRLVERKDYAAALEILERQAKKGQSISAALYLDLLIKTGRFQEAIDRFNPQVDALRELESETWFEVTRAIYRRELAKVLNAQAYFRVVGNLDLDLANRQVEEALAYVPASSPLSQDQQSRTAMLDTRGFIRCRLGDYEGAIADLDKAVEQSESELKEALKSDAGSGRNSLNAQEYQATKRQLQKSTAVIIYHRGLAHDASGDKESAEKDFARVRALGFEPNEDLF